MVCDNCRMMKPPVHRITRREREILNAVFALDNRATADEIRQRLVDPPGDSSVRVMLARLERKGLLRHAVDGVRYVYSATRSSQAAGRSAVNEIIETFFNGSMVHMMTALVRRGTWTSDELDTLEAAIEAARSQARQPRSEP
jgi:BlaI family penicillinase repressor